MHLYFISVEGDDSGLSKVLKVAGENCEVAGKTLNLNNFAIV